MTTSELIDIIEYGIKYYRDSRDDIRFGLMEYFSLTDIEPNDLAKIASKEKTRGVSVCIRTFSENSYWVLKEIDISSKMHHFHSVKDHEMQPDEKLAVVEKLESEGFPIREGVYNRAVYLYVTRGIDSISKERIREEVINAYNGAKGIHSTLTNTGSKVLIK